MGLRIPATTYLMRTAGETLVAESFEELAELTELALDHDDDPSTWRVRDRGTQQLRQLEDYEFQALMCLVGGRMAAAARATAAGGALPSGLRPDSPDPPGAGHGAGLAAASQSFDTTSPTGRAMLGMLAVFAELQRSEIRERTRHALAAKKRRGEAISRTPYGLRRAGKSYEPNPATWPIVAHILEQRAGGATCQAIAAALNADTVPARDEQRNEKWR